MRILVTGGRDYNDYKTVSHYLDSLRRGDETVVIIHGGASGADSLAGEWAEYNNALLEVYYANWHRHGRAAGPIRNEQMLRDGKPDLVVAFPGGRGTKDMVSRARRAGLAIIEAETID